MPRTVRAAEPPAWIPHLLAWYDCHKRDLPWRRASNPYAIWLSETMLQQTQVATVIPFYRRFIRRFPSLAALATADIDDVLRLWSGLGYYTRARNLHRAARQILDRFDGRFPRTADELRGLPGVGHYTAGAVASIAFGQRVPAVDGNVLRVLSRVFNLRIDVSSERGRRAVRSIAASLVPARRSGDFNQALMELGATVCLPRSAARCEECPLAAVCRSRAAGTVAARPVKSRTSTVRPQTHVVVAIRRRNRWLIAKRPDRGLWAGLWELPSGVVNGSSTLTAAGHLAQRLGGSTHHIETDPFCRVTRALSHRSIRFVGYVCHAAGKVERPGAACTVSERTNRAATVRERGPYARATLPNRANSDRTKDQRWVTIEQMADVGMSAAMAAIIRTLRLHISTKRSN